MRKINKARFAVAISVLTLILVGLVYGTVKVVENNLKKDQEGEKVIRGEDNYILNLDYPKTGISLLDQEVDKYISKEKDDFMSKIEGLTPEEGTTFDMIAFTDRADYEDAVFLHVYKYEYLGGANYSQKDRTFIYDKKEEKFANVIDLLDKPENLQRLSDIAKEYVKEYMETNHKETFSAELIDEGTAPKVENFEYISLSEEGMKIYYPPYSVGCRADGDVEITIPFDRLKGVLKERYAGPAPSEEPPQEEVPVVQGRDLSQFKGKKLVAITFDDGPRDATTIPLVDALEKFDAKVTFFVVGCNVKANSEALKYAYEHGHQIGSHTYSHLDLTKLDEGTLKKEIDRTDKRIEEVIGIKPSIMRPPYGSKNEFVSKKAKKALIFWNVDTVDWQSRDSKAVEKEFLAGVSDGAIVLLHDIYETSVEGCLNAMKKLKEEGYAFVTIDEMAKLKGIELEAGENYYSM